MNKKTIAKVKVVNYKSKGAIAIFENQNFIAL